MQQIRQSNTMTHPHQWQKYVVLSCTLWLAGEHGMLPKGNCKEATQLARRAISSQCAHLSAASTADVHAEHVMPLTDSCKARSCSSRVSKAPEGQLQLLDDPAPLTSALEGMLCTDTEEGAVTISVSATGSYFARALPSNCLSLSMACCCCSGQLPRRAG